MIWLIQAKRILVIEPHPDDGPLGLGASLAQWAGEGREITTLMLSDRGEPTWLDEARESAKILAGTGLITVETLHHTTFHMERERHAILRSLEEYRDRLKPDIVFMPAMGDLHQDHATAANEARRVFKGTTLLGYEIVRSNLILNPILFIPATDDQVNRKCDAVSCYKSQQGKLYTGPDAIRGLAAVRGAQCDSPSGLAEAFSVEWMVA